MARERSRSRSSYSYSSYSSEHRPSKAASRKEDKGGLAGESKASEAAPSKTNGEKPPKVKELQARSGTRVASAVQQETKVALDNLQEMLAERQRELAKETNPDRRKDMEKDIEILKQWQAEGASKVSSAGKSTPIKAVSGGEHAKVKEKESRHTLKAESKGKASKEEAKMVKEPKEKPKKGKTSTEKAQEKQAKEPKPVTKAEKASKKAPSNEVKQKSKGDTAKAAPTDKHEAAQGSTKQKEEKKSHTTEEAPAKKADKSAAPESTKRKKDKKETAANVKEVPEQVEPKHAEAKENPRDKLLQSAEMIEQAKEALRHLKQKATEAEAVPAVPEEMPGELPAEDGSEQPLMEDKVTVLMPSEKVPPCELPLWHEFGLSERQLQAQHQAELEAQRLRHETLSHQQQVKIENLEMEVKTLSKKLETKQKQVKDALALTGHVRQNMLARLAFDSGFRMWQARAAESKHNQLQDVLAKKLHDVHMSANFLSAWRQISQTSSREKLLAHERASAGAVRAKLFEQMETERNQLVAQVEDLNKQLGEEAKQRAVLQDNLKRVFMRGVCALNFEAMSLLNDPQGGTATMNAAALAGATEVLAAQTEPPGPPVLPEQQEKAQTEPVAVAALPAEGADSMDDTMQPQVSPTPLPFVSYTGPAARTTGSRGALPKSQRWLASASPARIEKPLAAR